MHDGQPARAGWPSSMNDARLRSGDGRNDVSGWDGLRLAQHHNANDNRDGDPDQPQAQERIPIACRHLARPGRAQDIGCVLGADPAAVIAPPRQATMPGQPQNNTVTTVRMMPSVRLSTSPSREQSGEMIRLPQVRRKASGRPSALQARESSEIRSGP